MVLSMTVHPTPPTAAEMIQPLPIDNHRLSTATLQDAHKPKTLRCGAFLICARRFSKRIQGWVLATAVNDVETLWTIHEVLVGYHFVFALVSVILKMLGAALLTVAALLIGATSAATQNLKLVTLTVLAEVVLVLTFIVAMSCRWSAFGTWELDSGGKLTAESSAALSLGIVQTISAIVWCVAGTLILRRHDSLCTYASSDNAPYDAAFFTKQYACSAFHSTEIPAADMDSVQGASTVSLTEGRHQSNYCAEGPTSLFSMPTQPPSSSEQHVTVSSERMLTCFYPQPRKLQQPAYPSVVYAVTPDGVLCSQNLPSTSHSQADEISAVGVGGVTWQSSSEAGNAKRVFSGNLPPRLRKNSLSVRQPDMWSPVWPASAPVSPRIASEM